MIKRLKKWFWNGADGWADYNHKLLALKSNRTEHEDRLLEAWDKAWGVRRFK